MMTMRQIERLWQLNAYERLIDDLCSGRAEAVGGIRQLLRGAVAAAALTIVRSGELHQAASPHVAKMIRFLLSHQQADGGFGDPATTALCVRALASCRGSGECVERGLGYLQCLQKETGEWPREPMRRFPADPAVTAFVVLQLTETRRPDADRLIEETIDRLAGDVLGDDQLTPLRRRVAARASTFAA